MEEGAYVWRKLMTAGAMIASGSDFPVELPNPMLGFYAAITRQDPMGQPASGWMPAERMSREEALASFTRNAAFAAHAETRLGSLEAGKLADLVVLGRNPLTEDSSSLVTIPVERTMVGGRWVYES